MTRFVYKGQTFLDVNTKRFEQTWPQFVAAFGSVPDHQSIKRALAVLKTAELRVGQNLVVTLTDEDAAVVHAAIANKLADLAAWNKNIKRLEQENEPTYIGNMWHATFGKVGVRESGADTNVGWCSTAVILTFFAVFAAISWSWRQQSLRTPIGATGLDVPSAWSG